MCVCVWATPTTCTGCMGGGYMRLCAWVCGPPHHLRGVHGWGVREVMCMGVWATLTTCKGCMGGGCVR